jgi:DNA-binding sugar fermentation-stimulating protein
MDPKFADAMREAIQTGVEFYAYRVMPGEEWVELTEVPVEEPPGSQY